MKCRICKVVGISLSDCKGKGNNGMNFKRLLVLCLEASLIFGAVPLNYLPVVAKESVQLDTDTSETADTAEAPSELAAPTEDASAPTEGATAEQTAAEETTEDALPDSQSAADGDTSLLTEIAAEEAVVKPEKAAAQATVGLPVAKHSQAEIRAFIKDHPIARTYSTYVEAPSPVKPYKAGKLDDKTQQYGLNSVNLMRYIAGIDADVTLKDAYSEMAQAAALVIEVNGKLTHSPDQPEGMDDELYELGGMGAFGSCITNNSRSVVGAVLWQFMNDSDLGNISQVGHRRWVLKPWLKQIGFGSVESACAMYVIENTERSTPYTSVAWPGQNMPVEFFDSAYAWNVTIQKLASTSGITVKLVRKSDGKVWNFSDAKADGYFNVYDGGEYSESCVVFRPNGITYSDGDHFDVTISGATDKTIQYAVDFFSLCGGSHNYVNEVKISDPTCTERGIHQSYCDRCGEAKTRYTNAKGHTIDPKSYSQSAMVDGVVTLRCKICNEIMKGSVPTEFRTRWDWTSTDGYGTSAFWIPDVMREGTSAEYDVWLYGSSSDKEECLKYYTVTSSDPKNCVVEVDYSNMGRVRFNKTGTYTITVAATYNPSLKETFTVKVVNQQTCPHERGTFTKNAVSATCTEAGRTGDVYCDDCGKLLTASKKIPAKGHSWNAGVVTKEPTLTSTGTRKYTCKVCGETKTETLPKRTIVPIANTQIKSVKNMYYTGKAIKPALTITDRGETLEQGTDYELEYANNTEPGTATITVRGKEYYSGTTSVSFKILPGATKKVTCTNVASGMKVSWEKVPGATRYKVYRDGVLIKTTSVLAITDQEVKYNSGIKYTYKVVALHKTAGESDRMRTATYYRLMPVGIKSVTNPSAGKMTVKYDKNANSSGYVVRYGLKSDMSDAKVITVKGADTTSRTFGRMVKGKTYYVQARTYILDNGVRYYSGYCSTKKVTITK